MTAYNPAIVALNNMLREQIRLVEQFVEINQRMYESYSTGVNSNYRYTTLEDTQQVGLRQPSILMNSRETDAHARTCVVVMVMMYLYTAHIIYHKVSWWFTILLCGEIGRQYVKAPLAAAISPNFDLTQPTHA